MDMDILAQPFSSGFQGTDTAFNDIDLYPGLACTVQSINAAFINKGIDLDLDPRLFAAARRLLLALDALNKP